MKYINELHEGDRVDEIYMVRKKMEYKTKAGKPYDSLTLQDKTGHLDAKVWDPSSPGIETYSALDYVEVKGDVQSYNGNLQLIVRQLRVASSAEYNPADYLPSSEKDPSVMYDELLSIIATIKAPYMRRLLDSFFAGDKFREKFVFHSAAKQVHHAYVGGLLEHTLSVTKNCVFFADRYSFLDRDLLLTAAILHDIGKLFELSAYPENDYTDAGQLLGHIVIGANIVSDRIKKIEDFPKVKANELLHCILAHHGELEFGSPKKPSLAEALALSFADNLDAKMETFREATAELAPDNVSWLGFNRLLDANIRQTSPAYEE